MVLEVFYNWVVLEELNLSNHTKEGLIIYHRSIFMVT